MKTELQNILENGYKTLNRQDAIVLFATCCKELKQPEAQKQTPETLGKLGLSSVNYTLAEQYRNQTLEALSTLLNAKVVNYLDLAEAIEEALAALSKTRPNLIIPNELAELAVSLLPKAQKSVYCPFESGYKFAQHLEVTTEKFGETISWENSFFATVLSELRDVDFPINLNDPIKNPSYIIEGGLQQFQSAIAFPPLGVRYETEFNDIWARFPEKAFSSDVYHIHHLLAHVQETAICVVSNNFLTRTAASELQLKKDLVDKGWLKAVIALPERILYDTAIAVNLLVIDKTRTEKSVLLVNASGSSFKKQIQRMPNQLVNIDQILELFAEPKSSDISTVSDFAEFSANGFNLTPARYVLSEQAKYVNRFLESRPTRRLEECVQIISTQQTKNCENGTHSFFEYNLTSINEIGQLTQSSNEVRIDDNNLSITEKQKIQPGDILVSCRGSVGKIVLVDDSVPPNSLATQAFTVLRMLNPSRGDYQINSESLYQFLISSYGQQQLQNNVVGATVATLKIGDLRKIKIPYFSNEEIESATTTRQKTLAIGQQIETLRKQMIDLNKKFL